MSHRHQRPMMQEHWQASCWDHPMAEDVIGTSLDVPAGREGSFGSQATPVPPQDRHPERHAAGAAFPPLDDLDNGVVGVTSHELGGLGALTLNQRDFNYANLPPPTHQSSRNSHFRPREIPIDFENGCVSPGLPEYFQPNGPSHSEDIFSGLHGTPFLQWIPSSATSHASEVTYSQLCPTDITSPGTPRHKCPWPHCYKNFNRKGDLTRHITTAHEDPSSFRCPSPGCPRGNLGNGFARKDKLVDHLVSKKHCLSKQQAMHYATLHNARAGGALIVDEEAGQL